MDFRANILETIGNTPLIRLNKVASTLRSVIYAKAEFLNPGGSVKDRIGVTIIEDAESRGLLCSGGTIVEATSGNTGAGLAMVAAVKGYKCIVVMPDKMSDEKVRLLKAFGAKVVITPTSVEPDDPRSYYNVAKRIATETPNSFYANQYHNPVNPKTHYKYTASEIWAQTEGNVNAVVGGVGTGGTMTGIGKFLKEKNPNIRIIGIDPKGSIFYDYFRTGKKTGAHAYKVEGIGEDILPTTLDFSYIDDIIRVDDREAFLMTRRLVHEEGIFCGGSSGAAVAGAIKYAENLDHDEIIIVILPDSGSRYLSKIFSDEWMRENGFMGFALGQVKDLIEKSSKVISAQKNDKVIDVVRKMQMHNISQLPVMDNDKLIGLISETDLLNYMSSSDYKSNSEIVHIVNRQLKIVGMDTPVDELHEIFTAGNSLALVMDGSRLVAVVTKIDMIKYLARLSKEA